MAKKLVTYFSATGTTAAAAKALAEAAGADLYEIKPAVLYTKEDLDWKNMESRSSIEMKDHASRPAIADTDANIGEYDEIFIGFPIWWYIAPTIINTFLESYDFAGKTITLFATSGGSGFGKAVESLKGSVAEDTIIKESKVLSRTASAEEIAAWAAGFAK